MKGKRSTKVKKSADALALETTPAVAASIRHSLGLPQRAEREPTGPDEAARLKAQIIAKAAVHGWTDPAAWPFPEAAKLDPELGVMLGEYAVLLEQDCDALRGELKGGYFQLCPPEEKRSSRAPRKRTEGKAKPKWSHQLGDDEREKRRAQSKAAHDASRAFKRSAGRIDGELRAPLAGLYDAVCEPLLCLDETFRNGVDCGELCQIFGHNRKSFPRIEDNERQRRGRKILYGHRAFFQIAAHLLKAGTWLPDRELRTRFLDLLERKLREGKWPADVRQEGRDFITAARAE